MGISFIYLILYGLVLAAITWHSGRRQNASDYLNSRKSLSAKESAWTTFASLLTGYNFVLGVTFSYLYGLWYLMAFVGAGGAFVVLYFFYKSHLSVLQKDHNLFSLGDYFGLRYGNFTKTFANVIFCVGLFLFLVLQMFVNITLFSALLGLSKEISLILSVGVVSLYLWFGGFKTSVKTDIFQGALMLPIALAVLAVPFSFSLEKVPLILDFNQFWFAVGLALLQFLSLLAQPESFQRVFAVKNSLALKKGLIVSFVMLALVAGAITYLGLNFKLAGTEIDPSNLFSEGVLTSLPAWLSSLLVVSLVAAFMGTIDSSAFALGVLLTKTRNTPSVASINELKVFTVLSIVLASLCSLYLFSFLSAFYALISMISVIGTALLVSIIFKAVAVEVNTFLITGTLTFILGLVFKIITDNPLTALVPSFVGLLGFFGIRLVNTVFRQRLKT